MKEEPKGERSENEAAVFIKRFARLNYGDKRLVSLNKRSVDQNGRSPAKISHPDHLPYSRR